MFKVKMDNIVIDVIEDPVWVSYQQKNDLFLRTTEQYATGVVASDGSKIFLFNEISLEEIDQEEFLQLKETLEGEEGEEERAEEREEEEEETIGTEPEIILPRVPFTELQALVDTLKTKIEILDAWRAQVQKMLDGEEQE